jgi:uncharacterized membrane protein YfcA
MRAWHIGVISFTRGTAGGYCGATFARRISPIRLHHFIITVGFVLTVFYFRKIS